MTVHRRAVLLGTAALAGCHLGPDYQRPGQDIPAAFIATSATAQAAWPATDWWRAFGSEELNGLIDRARVYNNDLVAAAARVYQADAQVRISGAPLLPSVNANGQFSYDRSGSGSGRSSLGSVAGGSRYFDSRSYSAQLSASYDVDFWGKNRAALQSAQAAALSTRFDQETVALTVVTSVASTYFQMLGAQDRLRVAQQNLGDAVRTLNAYQARLGAGTANALDVSQQEALVAGQRANIPALQNAIAQQRLGLGILVGAPPERVTPAGGTLDTLPLPPVSPGLPSDLLLRRPDIAYAEAQLVAANANIRAARAAFFPDLSLTASGGLSSTALSMLTGPGTLVAQFAAALAQPIFDNGLRRGQLEQAKGRFQELAADYGKAIIQSFTDTEQALTALQYATEQERLQRDAVAVARRSSAIARSQLEAGTIDIITSLNTESTLFSDLDQLTQVRLSRFLALVNLYKALGGGFQIGPTT
jgi:NodT family efflux transporter outer membrane factor (OMF) lipoprotein